MYNETADYNEWLEAADMLDRVEILTGIDESSSLSMAITDFFNSFRQLASNVEDASVRTIVVNAGTTMCERFNALSSGLDRLNAETNTKIERQSQEVSEILAEIAQFNKQVISKDTHEVKSNDLKVRREQLLAKLSELVKFSYAEDQFGAIDVYIAGRNVVHRDSFTGVTAEDIVVDGDKNVRVNVDGMYLEAKYIGGSLGSLIETRDQELKSIREALDTLAGVLVTKVNELHEAGFSPAGGGIQFFEGSDARSIRVYGLLTRQPEYVAHSYNNTAGDNSLANDLASLGEVAMSELGGRSIVAYYGTFVGDVGSLSRTAQGMVENKELTTSQLQTRVESVSGVSLDEEMTNVTRFQALYEAGAKMINTVNDMLDTLLALGE